jgi:hypothetical protein
VRTSLYFLHHSLTQLALITLSPYTCTRQNRRRVSVALCPSVWRKQITARTSQLERAAMIVSMFHQWLLLHYAAKMYEGRCPVITNVTYYYWVCALALWQCISFYQPIGSWFWDCPLIRFDLWRLQIWKLNTWDKCQVRAMWIYLWDL